MGLCTYLAKPDTQTAPSLEQQCPQNPACSSVGGKPRGQLGSLSLTCQAPLQGQMGAEQGGLHFT